MPHNALAPAYDRVLALFETSETQARALHAVSEPGRLPTEQHAWAEEAGFEAQAGAVLPLPGAAGWALGLGKGGAAAALATAPMKLPEQAYKLENSVISEEDAALNWALGAYQFTAYKAAKRAPAKLVVSQQAAHNAALIASGVWFARDLVNTPAGDLGPENLELAFQALAQAHNAEVSVIEGEALLEQNYPMIHAVGRAAAQAPRLLDLRWGPAAAPKLTIVGKGVCFDTGGLDLKPSQYMRNMKKDMGGAAATMAIADMVMRAGLNLRLRVLIPAVENSVSASSFRPGDVLQSRAGLTVEVGNTDAEGRLVLADALTEADSETPDMLLDLATLTGAARVALGPDIAPFYTADDTWSATLSQAAANTKDALWRMPLWEDYDADLSSKTADICNITSGGFAGSITAALFLQRFVKNANTWAHFDIFAWNPKPKPGRPEGGEASAARAIFAALQARFGDKT